MISIRSLPRRTSNDWRSPLLIEDDARFDHRLEAPLDFYEYARQLGSGGADVLLLSPSAGSWWLSRHQFGRIIVQSGTAGGGVIFGGAAQAGSFVFCLQDSDRHAAWSLNGRMIAADDIAVLAPGKPFALVGREAHTWMSLSVPLEVLEAAGFSQARLHALGGGATLLPTRGATRSLSAAVMDALDVASASLHPQRSEEVERVLLAELAATIGTDDVPNRVPRYGGSRSLDRINRNALAFIRKQDGLNSHVEDLCRAIHVSERSLLRAFRKFFGVGPTRYMQLRRLNRVHGELQAPDGRENTVTGILTKCGVTELGRFAGSYRELFGESPSDTLKRRRALLR